MPGLTLRARFSAARGSLSFPPFYRFAARRPSPIFGAKTSWRRIRCSACCRSALGAGRQAPLVAHVGTLKMAVFPARGRLPDWARSGCGLTGSLTRGTFLAFSMTRDRISRSWGAALLRAPARFVRLLGCLGRKEPVSSERHSCQSSRSLVAPTIVARGGNLFSESAV